MNDKQTDYDKLSMYDEVYMFDDYEKDAKRTLPAGMSRKDMIRNAAYGLCGEAGEVIDHLKKYEFQGHALDMRHLVEEVGDILWYCALFAQGADIPLSLIAQYNIIKLRERYPAGFDAEKSIHRDTEDG